MIWRIGDRTRFLRQPGNALGVEFAAFEILQNLACAGDDGLRQSGELSHCNAVRTTRPSRHEPAQKHHLIFPFPGLEVAVADPRPRARQVGEFVIVRGEKRPRAQSRRVVEMFEYRPCDRQAIKGAGASPDLVENQQAASRGSPQDFCRFAHFHHKGRLTPGKSV